jgi:hypothetical protein
MAEVPDWEVLAQGVPTFDQVTGSLAARALRHEVVMLEGEMRLVVVERGGRLMGPFLPDGRSISWINPLLADAESTGRFLQSGDWNMGGDRIWIAPEVQYLATDRARFNDTVFIPERMDPGSWRLGAGSGAAGSAGEWVLEQRATLEAYSLARGTKTLDVRRVVAKVPNPLRHLRAVGSLMPGVAFAGWRQTVSLSETAADDIVSETWNVLQVPPGGAMLAPCSPRVEVSEIGGYRDAVPQAAKTVRGGHLRVDVTGDRQFKVGLRSAHLTGRLGYWAPLGAGTGCLLVRSFGNDPSGHYSEESFDQPGNHGNSVHLYHDDGELGGFGELECNAPAIGGPTGRSSSTDVFTSWLYVGPTASLREIAAHLLAIDLEI